MKSVEIYASKTCPCGWSVALGGINDMSTVNNIQRFVFNGFDEHVCAHKAPQDAQEETQ